MKIKSLKFLVGGLGLAVVTAVVIFAASPSHAQADETIDNTTEMVSNDIGVSNELASDTKDCSPQCMKNKECKPVCEPGCTVPCE